MKTWTQAALGEVTTILSGTTPDSANSSYWRGGSHVWVTPTDLGKLETWEIHASARMITDAALEKSNLPLVPGRSVVMSSRAPIGHLAIAGCDLRTNQGCKSFVCGEYLDPEFLFLTLRHRMPEIQALGAGATFVEVSKSALGKLEVSFPNIAGQRRIAARLKTQLAAVEQVRQAAQAQISEIDVLAYRIKENVSDELNAVLHVALSDVLLGIETGKSFQTTDRIAREDELGVLKVSAVSWSEFKPDEAKAVAAHYTPEPHHRIRAGDLLMSRANTVELVGAVVRVSKGFPNRLLSDKTLRLVLDESKVCPDYVMQVLRMTEARAHIEGNATGTSNSMRNISQGTIRATPIPLPPLPRQRAIAQRLREGDLALREARAATQAQLADIESLPSRLLAQAFDSTNKEVSS